MRAPRRSSALVAAALTGVLALLAGCSGDAAASGPSTATGGTTLEHATPVDDPKAIEGPTTAVVADAALDPVATNPKPSLPATVTDAQGTVVTVTDTSRILALDIYGSTSRIVYDLGLGKNVVGRDTSSSYAEISDKPLVTANGHELSGEAILALAPTVIITDTSLGPWDVILQMRDAGIPVVVVDSHRGLDNVGGLIRQVAGALGVPDEGEKLASRTEAAVTAKVAQIAKVAPKAKADKLRIVFLYVRGQAGVYYLFGKESGADALIDAVGAVDVATEIGWDGMKPMTDEGMVKAAPDVVLVMSNGLESVGGVDGLLERLPAVANTPAGEHRRIVDMDDTQVLSFGPSTADVLDALAVALYAPAA
ncbi:MAG: ABC transporter substrate-binding protein [Brevundimonas sp.]